MATHDVNTLTDPNTLKRISISSGSREDSDKAVAFELGRGRLDLCGRTWQIPVRPHWSEDPFNDQQWRRQYQSLTWLAPLRRRAVSGDLNARQAWWWLAATWLKSLDRLEPGEATPWRADVASVRACELVAGLAVVGHQPWLLASISTHLSWLDGTAEQSEFFNARPLTIAARYICHRTVGDTARSEELFTALADWWKGHFSPAGAPYPKSAEASVSAAHVLTTVDSCLASVSTQLPWNGHDLRLAESLVKTQAKRTNVGDVTTRNSSDQRVRPFVVDTNQAAYVGIPGTSAGGRFLGFEESDGGSAVDISFAHGGRVWLRGAVPLDDSAQEGENSYSIQTASAAFEIGLDRSNRADHYQRHRLVHSIPTGVTVWEGDSEDPFELPRWFETVDAASDLMVTVSAGSIRLTNDDRTFFLVRLPVLDNPNELAPSAHWNPSFRLYLGPWHARLIDVLHQSGPATAQLTTERLSRLAGPSEPDGDLQEVYAGAGWRVSSNRAVLRAEQSRVPAAGRLVLTSSDGNHVVTGRGSRSKSGYLDIGDVPHGEYELSWVPVNGSLRRGPLLKFTGDTAVPVR